MKSKVVHDDGARTFVVVLDKGDDAVAALTQFAMDHDIAAASLTAIGAFSRATIGYFDRDSKIYEPISIDEQVEVLSLVGDIALAEDRPKVHAHVVLGRRDGTTRGGHLLAGEVWPTLEVVITHAPAHLRRTVDAETGLPLVNLRVSTRQSPGRKRQLVRLLQKHLVNPPMRLALAIGVLPPTHALLETTGRTSGEPRRNPVGNGLADDGRTFWIVAEHGREASYVRNIEANPNVRVRIGRQWRRGRAELCPDDDSHARLRTIGRPINGLIVRAMGTDLLSVRIALDETV